MFKLVHQVDPERGLLHLLQPDSEDPELERQETGEGSLEVREVPELHEAQLQLTERLRACKQHQCKVSPHQRCSRNPGPAPAERGI